MKINKIITIKNLSRATGAIWVSTMIIFAGIIYAGSNLGQSIWPEYLGTALIADIITGIIAFILFVSFNLITSATNKVKPELKTKTNPTKCPFCAETIKKEAIKCKHCGEMLSIKSTSSSKK